PLRNYVFFEEGSTQFADRYARMTPAQAAACREEQLQDSMPAAPTGRSARQIAVYRNILNIISERLRRNPGTTITLTGMSARGPRHGEERAEAVKRYLVETFGIDGSRIAAAAREEPPLPRGRGPEDLRMLRAENQRVEISSRSPEMLVQVGEGNQFMLKPVEI